MVDVKAMWDFDDPAGSEDRFRSAAEQAEGADRAVLQTQVARALGLQGRFDAAHAVLDAVPEDDAEAGARIALERGRLRNSAGDPEAALEDFRRAVDLAKAAGLVGLRIDALHMEAIAAPTDDRVRLNREALALARASSDPEARSWEGSLLNNLGMALVDTGDLDEAHTVFTEAVAVRDRDGDVARGRVARWTVGWVLRLQGRYDEARQVQETLRRELEAAGEHDPYVDQELELLDAAEQ